MYFSRLLKLHGGPYEVDSAAGYHRSYRTGRIRFLPPNSAEEARKQCAGHYAEREYYQFEYSRKLGTWNPAVTWLPSRAVLTS